MARNSRWYCLAGLFLLTLSGCVQESTTGTTKTFSYQLWVPISVVLGGIAAGVGGWFYRKKDAKMGWSFAILGPALALLFGPSLFLDRAVVSDTGLSIRTGILAATAAHDVKYDDLQRVRITVEETRGRRGRKKKNTYLICELKSGQQAKVPVNNDVSEAAAPHFLLGVAQRKIDIVDETQGE